MARPTTGTDRPNVRSWYSGVSYDAGKHYPILSRLSPRPRLIISGCTAISGLLTALVFSMGAMAATSPVGASPGGFAVSPSGAATYSIPIFVPPGTNGMAPKLSLNYNSQGGNGLLGMGWSIGGLSVIHRCGATIAIDGFKGGVNYDANDRYCLDGERLISTGVGEYRTQHESWQKVIASSITAGNGPEFFTVYTKDGTELRYAWHDSGRITAQGQSTVRVWALTGVKDPHGNLMQLRYAKDDANGDYRPSYITYTDGDVPPS